jgi:hypothetical protein
MILFLVFCLATWSPYLYCQGLTQEQCFDDYNCAWCVNISQCVVGLNCLDYPPSCPSGAIIDENCSSIEEKIAKIITFIFVCIIDISVALTIFFMALSKTKPESNCRYFVIIICAISVLSIVVFEVFYSDYLLMISFVLLIIFVFLLCIIPVICSIKARVSRKEYNEI